MHSIYLTDKQYYELLFKIKEVVNTKGFKPLYYDSTNIGEKYTESNCGFCNEALTTRETAMWPDEFPQRTTMKYSEAHQHCPFDMREPSKEFRNGCFYTCYIFLKGKKDLTIMNEMINKTIEYAKKLESLQGKQLGAERREI